MFSGCWERLLEAHGIRNELSRNEGEVGRGSRGRMTQTEGWVMAERAMAVCRCPTEASHGKGHKAGKIAQNWVIENFGYW